MRLWYLTHSDQRMLRRACAFAQSRQSLRCSHTLSMEVDEGPTKNQTSSPTGWLRMWVWRMNLRRTKKCQNIMSWLQWTLQGRIYFREQETQHFHVNPGIKKQNRKQWTLVIMWLWFGTTYTCISYMSLNGATKLILRNKGTYTHPCAM